MIPDELLTTTRAVRLRLDFARPIERKVIEECVAIAQQAPSASNRQDWHFVIVTDKEKRAALGELYKRGGASYFARADQSSGNVTQERVRRSAMYLVEHIQDVPVHVIPCIKGRTDGLPAIAQAAKWGSIFPAVWSFMLAARARGLGSTITSFHLMFEENAAKILDIPYKEVMQACLLPLAYTKGTKFNPAPRMDLREMIHWEKW